MLLEHKNVLVTGATGALGVLIADRFVQAGARVVAVARDPGKLADLAASSPQIRTFSADLTNADAVERLFIDIREQLGAVDILVHTTGGYQGGQYVQEIAVHDWQKMIDLNLNSAFLCAKHALAHMAHKGGKIITISAMAAIDVPSRRAAYVVSKAGLIALTRAIAEEGKVSNVQANVIAPGIILTESNRRDMPDADHSKWVKPADIAEMILHLCSPGASAITGSIIRMP
ncbi:SDR family oxidoreductase [candidate division KSB1 bacterium]|nr:SDR family oxidoreductase [candidate division KSB1 bacterium]